MSYIGIILTSDEVEKKLSLLVLEILLDRATVTFPMSSVGVPSPVVLVQGSSKVVVEREQWRLCVLPVLQDPTWAILKTPKGHKIVEGRLLAHWQSLIGGALKKSFSSNGF